MAWVIGKKAKIKEILASLEEERKLKKEKNLASKIERKRLDNIAKNQVSLEEKAKEAVVVTSIAKYMSTGKI